MTNLTKGSNTKKEHWQNHKIHGVKTSCKIRLSYEANSNQFFYDLLNKYPEMCGEKCANNFNIYIKNKTIKP